MTVTDYRISDVMQMTAIKREHFNALRRGDNLPFILSNNDNVAGWARFKISDAFKLRLMMELMGGDLSDSKIRLPASFASKVVSNAIGYLGTHDPHDFAASSDNPIFLGVAEFTYAAEAGTIKTRTAWFCGPIEDLPSWIAKEAGGEWGGAVSTLNRVVMVNATEAAQHVLKKAAALGLIDQGRATE